jgi:ribosomal-protein-alanine N-acetyltransferase
MSLPVLHIARLTLRPPQMADLGAYLAYYAIPSDMPGKYRSPRPETEVLAILAADIDHWNRKGFGMWLLEQRDTGEIVGGCGIAHPDDWPSHEVTWWLMPAARGTGYATEASWAAIAFGYDTLGWPSVETHMRDENLPSRRLAERLGGKIVRRDVFPDGIARDVFELPHPGAAGQAMEATA